MKRTDQYLYLANGRLHRSLFGAINEKGGVKIVKDNQVLTRMNEKQAKALGNIARKIKELDNQKSISAVYLYGSVARGSAHGMSDLDIFIVLNDNDLTPEECRKFRIENSSFNDIDIDIHFEITALLVEAAALDDTRSFFADWTIRHPDIENGELLQHCGPWPISVARETPKLTYPLAFSHPGSITAEAKHGEVTLARFDGDNGEYSMLLGKAKGVDGPKGMGTYLWVEVENIKRLEAKIVEGPYIHHCVGIHKDVVPVLYEACKYMGITPDLYDPIEEDVKAYLRGE